MKKHIIGEYGGDRRGPLLICMAGMHGNEPAGVEALEIVFQLMEREPRVNPGFRFKGKLLGLLGNTEAYKIRDRSIEKDLNRLWYPEYIQKVRKSSPAELKAEDRELVELLDIIHQKIDSFQPERVVLLDLHTTSAMGGIFAIATDDPESVRIATELHAPVITGMLHGIKGTTLHYFSKDHFSQHPSLRSITGVAFEAGHHEDELSVNRTIAAIINCMRSIGNVDAEDVTTRHDDLLIEYSKDLPKIAKLVKVHSIEQQDEFRMKPGFRNFQAVRKGECIAKDRRGDIYAPADGLLLMPLYQHKGSDGFFLIQPVDRELEYGDKLSK